MAVRHAPGNVLGMAEVRHSRHARQRVSAAAERRTVDVCLVVDVGRVQGTMRVAGNQWQAGRRARTGDDPGIAAALGRAQPAEFLRCFCESIEAVQSDIPIGLPRRHTDEAVVRIAAEQGRGTLDTQGACKSRPPQLDLVGSHQHVADLVDRKAVPRLPSFGHRPQELVLDRTRLGRFDERIDTGRIGFEHRLRHVARHRKIGLRGAFEGERAH